MVEAVVASLPNLTARDVSERTEWLAREMFRAFVRHQNEINTLFADSRQGLFINRVEAALRKCIAESDPPLKRRSAQGGAFLLRAGVLLHLYHLLRPDGRKAPCDPACLHRPRRAADTDVTELVLHALRA